jgi:hypothetical protein
MFLPNADFLGLNELLFMLVLAGHVHGEIMATVMNLDLCPPQAQHLLVSNYFLPIIISCSCSGNSWFKKRRAPK